MDVVRIISTETIKAPKSSDQIIDLSPWDLQHLFTPQSNMGIVYKHPVESNQIERLKHSLSSTLAFFQPLAGHLKIMEHEDNIVSCSIICNNTGALFLHAAAENTCVADILEPIYVPSIVDSFFPSNGNKNYEGTSHPLLVVQVTELADGIFISLTSNHVVADGKSMWHFTKSWAEISSGHQISKFPTSERWFPNGIQRPIRFPFNIKPQKNHSDKLNFLPDDKKPYLSERLFHFTKEKIAQLKSKVNVENGTTKISSLQALLTHIWCSVIRSKQLDLETEVYNMFALGIGPRLNPPLDENFFGNAINDCRITMKVDELLKEDGLGKGAWKMNHFIATHTNEKLKNHYESWLKSPIFVGFSSQMNANGIIVGGSQRFDVYGNDFGWGKAVAVRSRMKINGLVNVFPGIEEGSIDLQVCLPYDVLEAMKNDVEFMNVMSN